MKRNTTHSVRSAGSRSGRASRSRRRGGSVGGDVMGGELPGGGRFRHFGHRWEGVGVVWTNTNRGKRSVVLDLKSPEDLSRFKELLRSADIYIENWRPNVSASLGLGFDQL